LINALVKDAPPYLILNRNKLVVAHAGIEEQMIGKLTTRIFNFCLNGEILITPDGNKQRKNWAENYRGKPLVAYGHTPTTKLLPEFRNNTVNLDQGCVYGGRLSAMRYPEMEFIQVNARAAYVERKKRGA
jgi:protein phosphatase